MVKRSKAIAKEYVLETTKYFKHRNDAKTKTHKTNATGKTPQDKNVEAQKIIRSQTLKTNKKEKQKKERKKEKCYKYQKLQNSYKREMHQIPTMEGLLCSNDYLVR